MIFFIIFFIQLDNQIVTKELVNCDSTSDFISQKFVNRNSITLRSYPSISLALLHNALTNKSMQINEELLTKIQFQSSIKVKIKSPTLLKVAPLISHDIILEILFLKQNDLLIDLITRIVVSHKQSFSIIEQDHYMKIDNIFMQVLKSIIRILTYHASKINHASLKIIIYYYIIKLIYYIIIMKDI